MASALDTYFPTGSKKPKYTFGGFAGNLFGGVGDLFVGLATAPYYISKAAYHDATKGGPSQLKGMGSAMYHGIADYYSPLAHGNFKKFGKNVYTNPVQIALDAATIATLGGAAAGSAAAKVAQGAAAGSKAARLGEAISGMQRVRSLDHIPLEYESRRLPAADGSYLIPKSRTFTTDTGKQLYAKPVERNPVVRLRKDATQGVLSNLPGNNPVTRFFSPERRGTRLAVAQADRMERRMMEAQVVDAAKALNSLPKAARTALFYRIPGFNTADRYMRLVEHRRESLANPALGSEGGKVAARTRAELSIKKDLNRLEDPAVAAEIINPSEATLRVEQMLLDAEEAVQLKRASRQAPGDIQARRRQPLEHVGITPEEGERIGIISYSEKRVPKKLRKGKSGRGLQQRKSGEDMEYTGIAFEHALYNADPSRILRSYLEEVRYDRIGANLEYALAISEKYDPVEHAALVKSGDLTPFTIASKPIKDLLEVNAFVERELLPIAKEANNTQVDEYLLLAKTWAEELKEAGHEGFVMPTAAWEEMRIQVQGAKGLVQRFLATPVQLWRDVTLALKGSFYLNNFLGNLMLGLVSYGVWGYTKALFEAGSKRTEKGRRARKVGSDQMRGQSSALHQIDEYEPDRSRYSPVGGLNSLATKVMEKLAPLTEENFRAAAVHIELERMAKGLAKARGISKDEAITAVVNDAKAVDALVERAAGNMLDYTKLTPFEKEVIRTAYPFWSFIRSMFGRSVRLTLDEPWKVEVMKMLSEIGLDHNEESFGELPPWLTGVAQLGPLEGGKAPIVSTYAANPFSSVSDTANQIGGLFSGTVRDQNQSPLAAMNPYIASAIEAASGRDLFFGSPLYGSTGQIFGEQLSQDFWPLAMYDKVRYPNPQATVQRTPEQIALQWAGVPVGTLNVPNLRRSQAIAAYYDRRAADARRKRDIKRNINDRGRYLGIGG